MSVLKKLAGETAAYGISTMLGRLLNYLLVMLHTELFLPDELAVQVQMYSYAAFALVLYTFGMETAFFRFARKEEDRGAYYNLILSAVIIVSCLFSGSLFLFADRAADVIHYPGYARMIRWFAVIMAVDAIVSIPFARLRLEGKMKKFVWVRLSNIFIIIGLNLFFLLVCRDIYEGKYLNAMQPLVASFYQPERAADYIILANLIANLLFLPMLWKELTTFRFVLDRTLFRPVWVYAFPILVMNLGAMTNMMFDRTFLQFLLPEGFYPGRSTREAIGIYGQCFKLSIFMNLAIQAFKYAAEPFFFVRGEDKNAPPLFARVMKWFVVACVVIWVGVSLQLELLAEMFLRNRIYHEGISVVPWLLAGFMFLGIYYNLAVWFKLTDQTRYGTYLTLAGGGCVILLNFLLVPVMGYMGCAVAFASSSFIMMVLCYYYGQRHFPVPYEVRHAFTYIAAGAGIIFLFYCIPFPGPWASSATGAAVFLLLAGMVYLAERQALRRQL